MRLGCGAWDFSLRISSLNRVGQVQQFLICPRFSSSKPPVIPQTSWDRDSRHSRTGSQATIGTHLILPNQGGYMANRWIGQSIQVVFGKQAKQALRTTLRWAISR